MRYANNSNYKNDTMIRKEVYVTKAIVDELRRVLEDSEVSHNSVWAQTCVHGFQSLAARHQHSSLRCT